uniref:Uncharacterized protein n=1 Tax=Tanacetum cinerariifolium TaxID=118510 RepID=A0A699KED8_TANCI|nr:hypothetical protein [Tanacetum cinerariifolium]
MTKTKSFNKNTKHKALYHAIMKSILEDEDAMDKGVVDKSKKRKPDDAGPDQGLKRKKTCKKTKQSKKAKSTGTSKGTTKSQPKSTGKSAQAEETVFKAEDTQVPKDLGEGNTDEPPIVKADPNDWFKKPERPPTLDPEWNGGKVVDNMPTQKWLSDLAKVETSSKTFDDLMSTPIDFSAFVMNRPHISDLTQDILVGSTYNILKGTCRSYVELEYNMEVCYKALTDQLDLNNPEGDRYPFDLSKPLPLTKAAKYDLPGIEDMVPNLWSLIKVAYGKHALLVRDTLHDMATNFRIVYNKAMPKRKWSHLDQTQSHIMVKEIDRHLRERRLMRSLEKFVGGRHYGEDLRLL